MNNYYKYAPYLYIIFGVFFLWQAFNNWDIERNRSYMSLLFVVVCVFMFFFRRKMASKYTDDNQ